MIRENKKSYFLMLIAFIVTCLCVTQVFIVAESNAKELRKYHFIESYSNNSINCSADLSLADFYFENNNSFLDYPMPTDFRGAIMEEVEKSPLNTKLLESSVNFRSGFFHAKVNEDQFQPLVIHVLPDDIFQYLTPYSYWETTEPTNDYAILLVDSSSLGTTSIFNSFPYYDFLDRENITLASIDNEILYSSLKTFNFSHKILYETFEESDFGKILWTYLYTSFSSGLILSEPLFKELLSSLYTTNPNFENLKTFVNAQVIHDTSKLEYNDEEIHQIVALKDEIQTNLLQDFPIITRISMSGIDIPLLEVFEEELAEQRFMLTLLTIPVTLMLGMFIYYCNKQFKSQTNNFSEYFKTHGISKKVLFFSELLCLLTIAALGFLLGITLSIPTTSWLNNGVWFFGNAQSLSNMVITPNSLLNSTIFYFGIFVLVNVPVLLNQTFQNSKIKEVEINAKRRKMLLLGYILLNLVSLTLVLVFQLAPIYWPSYNAYLISSVISVILLASSILLSVNKLFPLLAEFFSKKLWRRRVNLLNFSLLNISINKKTIQNALVIFSASFCVLILAVSLSFGIINSKQNDAKFSVGADAQVSISTEADLSSISDFLPSSIKFTEVYKLDYVYDTLNRHILSFYVIDPISFSEIAYYSRRDTGISLQKAISKIENTNSCLIGNDRAQDFSLIKGEEYLFRLSGENDTVTHEFHIEELVESWPFFIEKENSIITNGIDINEPLQFIISYSTGQFLFDSNLDFVVNRYLLFDSSNIASDTNILQTLVQDFDYVEDLETSSDKFQYEINKPLIRLTVNFSFFFGIIALLILLGSLVFYNQIIFIQRKNEYNIYFSLGATKKQIIQLLFYELSFVLIISSIFGLLLGIILVYLQPIVTNPYYIGGFSPTPVILLLIIVTSVISVYGISALLIHTMISLNLRKNIKQIQTTGEG